MAELLRRLWPLCGLVGNHPKGRLLTARSRSASGAESVEFLYTILHAEFDALASEPPGGLALIGLAVAGIAATRRGKNETAHQAKLRDRCGQASTQRIYQRDSTPTRCLLSRELSDRPEWQVMADNGLGGQVEKSGAIAPCQGVSDFLCVRRG